MHELPVTKSILDIVLRHAAANEVTRIATIDLSIGALSLYLMCAFFCMPQPR